MIMYNNSDKSMITSVRAIYKSSVVLLMMMLAACEQQAAMVSLDDQTEAKQKSVNSYTSDINAAAELKMTDKATIIPSNLNAQKQLLGQLEAQVKAGNDSKQRLMFFVRYAILVNSEQVSEVKLLKLIDDIKSYLKLNSEDYELVALLGSATSFSSVYYPQDTGKQQLLAKKGIRLLDRAKKNAPNHLGVRLQRGISYAAMPAFLGKAELAVKDLQFVKVHYPSDAELIIMVNFYLGKALVNTAHKSEGVEILQTLVKQGMKPWSLKAAQIITEQN